MATDASQQMTASTVVPRVRGSAGMAGISSSLPCLSAARGALFDMGFEPLAALGRGFGGAPGGGVNESNAITLEAGFS